MLIFRKLGQSILFWPSRFCGENATFLPQRFVTTRKAIPLNVISNNMDIYNNITKEKLSNAEWQSIREKCLQIQQIKPSIVDSMIIDVCLKNSQINNAIAYFKFLKENNYPINLAIIGKYLRLYVLKQDLSDKDKIEIIETYNDLRKKHSVLDAITAEHCITSLCLTDQWEKTFEILEMLKITNIPGITTCSALAAAAFKNKKPDIAWKVLLELTSRNLMPQDNAFTSYLLYCQLEGKENFNENMIKMLDFWGKYNIIPYNRIISAYIDTASKYGWFSKATTISKTGTCGHCGQSLSKIIINQNTFAKLVESVMKQVIIGSDIYHKSNPEELKNFKKFIDSTKPYDIVIDGLNLTYIDKNSTQTLYDVVKYFRNHNKKVLVLTRNHQKKLPIFKNIQKIALVFYTKDLSADDPYILYATMISGKDAMFVSMDLMRQHKHCLKNSNLHHEFKKWQCSHQYFVKKNNKHFYIQEPFVYLPTVQKNENCWHVPYISDDVFVSDSHEFPDKWYCLRQ